MAYDKTPQSRNEEILLSMINKTEYDKTPQSREEELLLELKDTIEKGGGGDSQHHYSTDEQVVGTWIDGSTLYEKSYHVPTVTSTYITVDSTINTSTVKLRDVSMGTIVIGGAFNNAQYVNGHISYTSFLRIILVGTGLNVGMEAPPSESITDFDFTIRYTKNTN